MTAADWQLLLALWQPLAFYVGLPLVVMCSGALLAWLEGK